MEATPISFRADAELMAALDNVPTAYPSETRSAKIVRLLRTTLGLPTAPLPEPSDRKPIATLAQVMTRLEDLETRLAAVEAHNVPNTLPTAKSKQAAQPKDGIFLVDERTKRK